MAVSFGDAEVKPNEAFRFGVKAGPTRWLSCAVHALYYGSDRNLCYYPKLINFQASHPVTVLYTF